MIISMFPAFPFVTLWLENFPALKGNIQLWKILNHDHCFPEVRLKGYLEMRGADGGSWGNICALPALWVGLL